MAWKHSYELGLRIETLVEEFRGVFASARKHARVIRETRSVQGYQGDKRHP
jgi:hypothetical protein